MRHIHYQFGRSPQFTRRERAWLCSTMTPPAACGASEGSSVGILSADEFQAHLEQEQVLALRHARAFSVLAYDVTNFQDDPARIENLVESLKSRLHTPGEIGWLQPGWLGVLLPRTPLEVARDLETELRDELDCVEFSHVETTPQARIHYFPPYQKFGDEAAFASKSSGELAHRASDRGARGQIGTLMAPANNGHVAMYAEADTRFVSASPLSLAAACAAPWWKRTFDRVGAALGLLLLSPLFLLVALLIKVTSAGPVFFRQQRAGYLGRSFSIFKFRTMHTSVDTTSHQQYVAQLADGNATLTKLSNDRDFIFLGKFLRKTAIDELPQLINVLRGEMSLVGPRPDVVAVDDYPLWQRARFNVLPGLTGWWQVRGKNRTTFNEMIQLDIEYVQKYSLLFDLKILALTVPAIVKQLGDHRA